MISIAPTIDKSSVDELNDSLTALKKKEGFRDTVAISVIAVLWIPISIVLLQNIGSQLCGAWVAITIAYLISIPSVYYFIQSKTRLRFHINELVSHIRLEKERIATEKEEWALALLNEIELEMQARKTEMLSIESQIKYKRKWRADFENFPDILKRNKEMDSAARDRILQFAEHVRPSHKEYFKWNGTYLDRFYGRYQYYSFGYLNYHWLAARFESMQNWEPPDYSSRSYPPRELIERYDDDDDERNDEKKFSGAPPYERPTKEAGFDSQTQNIDRTTNRTRSTSPEREQATLFNQLSLTEKSLEDVPKQKQRLPTMERIKISDMLRRQVNERKIKIGKMGELAVIEHERLRLQQNESNSDQKIMHVSLTNDAAGYDIQSWNGEKVIYIEVKTTVGDFWSNLFFTQNEFDKMNELGEQYYLYRISNFKLDTGKGNLFIYAGKDLIMDSFEFNSKMYLLSEKSH